MAAPTPSKSLREAISRGIVTIANDKVTYSLKKSTTYSFTDPEEWVRAETIAFLTCERDYPPERMRTEVTVPRRTPSDLADVVVYEDDACRKPYLVVENKAAGQTEASRKQGIEQAFGNANSLRAKFTLYDEGGKTLFFDVANFNATERKANLLGTRDQIQKGYGQAPVYKFIADTANDIAPATSQVLETRMEQAHSIIWAGGKRDPLLAFDEWSKLLFAKANDERKTPTGEFRKFQIGTNESDQVVATRVRKLFALAAKADPSIFPKDCKIDLPDSKIAEVVRVLEDLAFLRVDVDSIGAAFEHFFGSVFRGQLGQYFTRRELSRFAVALLDLTHEDFVIDPTAGSGGFLLEALLQVWHGINSQYSGKPEAERERLRLDFAGQHVYGIEIHDILSRICKINLFLHHDGHTHIESGRSCLDSKFSLARLNPPIGKFSVVVGNPPFGDEVKEGDPDKLGDNELANFVLAEGFDKLDSEQLVVERAVGLLEEGGRFGLVVPDGLLNNQGASSNCPRTREFLVRNGHLLAVVSLPDFAFRKSGAQNKTSLLFFQKFTSRERAKFEREYAKAEKAAVALLGEEAVSNPEKVAAKAVGEALAALGHVVFMAEADQIGYTPTGAASPYNDLYASQANGWIGPKQDGTIIGEYRAFRADPGAYKGRLAPDCMGIPAQDLWTAHPSHRIDPKYHLFKRQESLVAPPGWTRKRLGEIMTRRDVAAEPEKAPLQVFQVMTLSQTGDIRQRPAGKGRNPPEWKGMYFDKGSSTWYAASKGDIVYSSIDLWKGCISVVPPPFDGALVTKEFPIYKIVEPQLEPAFLAALLRTRYFQRAFRAITTGHSNRRRTQQEDFENLDICFPPSSAEQAKLVTGLTKAKVGVVEALNKVRQEQNSLSDLLDGRGDLEPYSMAAEDEGEEDS